MSERYAGLTRSEAYELSEDVPSNPTTNPTIGDVIARRFSRRTMLKGALASTALTAVGAMPVANQAQAAGLFGFTEIEHGVDETHHVAPGYSADILIRWGDPLSANAPEFDPQNQTAAAQEQQFGYNNDFLGYIPLEARSGEEERGLLCVNHEFTNEEVMFPGIGRQDKPVDKGGKFFADMTKELVEIEMAAHGGSIVEVVKKNGKWSYVRDSEFNRRITAHTTKMEITGPATGSKRMQTSADPRGNTAIGTFNNCAGGITPWGTYLMAEENFHGYFMGDLPEGHAEQTNHKRYGVPGTRYNWGQYDSRFDVGKEPNEPNRFGWVVEVDPMDPSSTPKKRTALGRMKHEGAESVVNKDGTVVVYMGDDQRFDYVYKFVTTGKFTPGNRDANMGLLEEGTLYAAKFNEDGTLDWLPLVHGQGPLTAANGFNEQADVVIEARRAADLLGATQLDRPEDVEPNPKTGRIYVMLTNNHKRKAGDENPANPRAENVFGHIVEIIEPASDFTATKSNWEILVKCGDPAAGEVGALWNPATSKNGWFASPDNCAIDHSGRLWVTTDQGSKWSKSGTADGVWAVETDGDLRGTGKMFFRVPIGAEMCGPRFTPSDTTLFVAVQHPATDGVKAFKGFERNSTFEDPATRWPDFKDGMPPRPSVVAITKDDGGVIGS
ncbi:MAG: PhoX family phosphatase [Alphaproteobacteria bacterium]|nr:PhoX family phosphatase [Alphaproteobacteria bacterium]